MKKVRLPYNLQFFGEGDTGSGTEGGTNTGQQTANQQTANIDYSKIQQMLDGTLRAKEDTALKAYFKEQGLSQQEVEQAITSFKQQKAANQPDVSALQTQALQAQASAQKAAIENAAILSAVGLGIDAKTIPYMLKLAELNQVIGTDGKINEESLKNALNKVLEDVPALKPSISQSGGFVQVGAGAGASTAADETALKSAFRV